MRYVAFLRAINVRGHASVRMDALRAVFEARGCGNVRSYIQSGNVVFDAEESILPDLRESLSGAHVFIRPVEELQSLAAERPFAAYEADRSLKLYVVFLAEAVAPPPLPIIDVKENLTLTRIEGREAFVVSGRKAGVMYGFPNVFVERELGVIATSRNWNTIVKLLAFARRTQPAS
jgi:uncharacterized protein (DUF1697 family)